MKIDAIKAESRSGKGSKLARRLRSEGKVPVVLYGHGQDVELLSMTSRDVMSFLESGHHLVALQIGDRTERALVKEAQFDTWGSELLHVDFNRVALDELVTVEVAVVAHGTPKGVLAGGVLEQPLHNIEVQCKADDIPDQIRVEVGDLETGAKITVKDLPLPAGVKALDDEDAIVFIVQETREEVAPAAPAEAGAAEPEVIKRAKAEEEEGEEKGK